MFVFFPNLDACTTVHAAKLWKSLNAELKQCQNKVQKGVHEKQMLYLSECLFSTFVSRTYSDFPINIPKLEVF